MRNCLSTAIRMGWLCAFALLTATGVGQTLPDPKIQTPNVATLDKFEDIPVDMVTGTPNISVPIHTLHYGNISVPIALRYHTGALRVSQHPGWVGLGWDLEAGGSITRQVRGAPDEYNGPAVLNTELLPAYYPISGLNGPSGSQVVNNAADWNTSAKLDTVFSGLSNLEDVQADEFTFNFMGHTGKFYYEGPTLGWQVASDENILVQMNATPFVTGTNVISTVLSEFPLSGNRMFVNQQNVNEGAPTQVFSGFVLTVPDGTKYYFGGAITGGNGIGIEFYCMYNLNGVVFNANTWLLTKIVDVDGNEVDFNYSASYAEAELGIGFTAMNANCQVILPFDAIPFHVNLSSYLTTFPVQVNMNQYQGNLNLPLYLNNITCPNETVTFNRNADKSGLNACLRTDPNVFRFNPYISTGNGPEWGIMTGLLGDGQTVGGNTIFGPDNLQWMQLNNISVANGNGQVYRNYNFSYSSNSNQRLMLQSFQELDNQNNSIEKYSFGYNIPPSGQSLTSTEYVGDMSDHWGYFNGKTLTNVNPGNPDGTNNNSIFSQKVTDPSLILTGTLTSITYPTGGSVSLSWQAHDYSQVVANSQTPSLDRQSFASQTGNAGGCRISEVQSYLADGTLARDKRYLYVRGYSNTTPNGTGSSGILNGTPTYFMTLSGRQGSDGKIGVSIQVISINSLGVYGYNSEGSYIGYDQVVELDADNTYTIHYFTSYGPDLNGVSHWDIPPPAGSSVGWAPGDNYYPYNELDMERGKEIGAFKYNSHDVLVEKTVNTYRSDAARFNNALRLLNFNNSYSGCASYDALILATANLKYTYDYYVVSRTVTTYDQNGMNPQVNTTAYQYNANNLASVKTETDSKGETIVTTYKYPPDMTDGTSQAMTAAHILTPVMKTTVTNDGSLVSSTTTNYYSPSSGLYKPQTVQVEIGSNPVETRQSFYAYDMYGNVNELSKTNDIHEVYLWGYFGQYPVVKITGTTLSAVNSAIPNVPNVQSQIYTITNVSAANSTINSNLLSLVQQLRTNLPNALVTIYTYLPLSGVTSEIDPRGFTTNYQYDTFQRLQMITDNDNNVLKTFSYQYQIQQ